MVRGDGTKIRKRPHFGHYRLDCLREQKITNTCIAFLIVTQMSSSSSTRVPFNLKNYSDKRLAKALSLLELKDECLRRALKPDDNKPDCIKRLTDWKKKWNNNLEQIGPVTLKKYLRPDLEEICKDIDLSQATSSILIDLIMDTLKNKTVPKSKGKNSSSKTKTQSKGKSNRKATQSKSLMM